MLLVVFVGHTVVIVALVGNRVTLLALVGDKVVLTVPFDGNRVDGGIFVVVVSVGVIQTDDCEGPDPHPGLPGPRAEGHPGGCWCYSFWCCGCWW